MTNAVTLAPRQIALIKRTIAADCTNDEFDLFMEIARHRELNPFTGQVVPIIFNKNKPEKRRMVVSPTRGGFRVIAQRCGDYRPASERAQFEYDEKLKGPTNPKGIVSVTVNLWKQDKKGDWYPVIGEADWDEFAPVVDEWAYDPQESKRKPTGKKALDASGNWARMPKVMITKCAEAQALRAGWPDQFGGLYAEEEMEQAVAADASEVVREEEERARLEKAGGFKAVTLFFGEKLENVPLGHVADRCMEFINKNDAERVAKWAATNTEPLRQFWALAPNDALEVKKAIEAKGKEAA